MEGDYYKTKASVEEYIRLAKDVHGGALIEKLKQVLPASSALLEIGSGPGTDWNILNETYRVTGSDNSTEFLNHLRAKNPSGTFLELDATTLKTDQQFDGIYSNKVMHHLKDEELVASTQRQHDMLNTGGIICHSFWRGEGSEIFKGLFVNYQDAASLTSIYGAYFEILFIQSYQEFEADDSLLLIGRKS